ncbi:MAG TPA: hypothetical protein PKE61_01605, partial [Burkholderiaceae bacterium]|nr:hypothetical protein [Burkholderiaceae bacterium]
MAEASFYPWIEQLLVPAALVLASWQVLRRSARRPALRRALLVRPLQGLAALGASRPLGTWAERRLAALATPPAASASGAAACASGCGSCGGCATSGPANAATQNAGTQPVRWLGRAG